MAAPIVLSVASNQVTLQRSGGQLIAPRAPIILSTASGQVTLESGGIPANRGDDAFRSAGEREKFWQRQAEKWLEDQLEDIQEAVRKPRKARQRVAKAFLAEAEKQADRAPQTAPRIDIVKRLVRDLAKPRPDFTEIAAEVEEQQRQLAVKQRRRRDLETVLMLVA